MTVIYRLFLVFFLGLSGGPEVHARSIHKVVLFRNGMGTPNYIQELNKADEMARLHGQVTLVFSDGQTRTVGRKIGNGGNAVYYELLGTGRALRVPLNAEPETEQLMDAFDPMDGSSTDIQQINPFHKIQKGFGRYHMYRPTPQKVPDLEHMGNFIKGYEYLLGSDLPMVQVFPDSSNPPEFIEVEKNDFLFTAQEAFIDKTARINDEERAHLWEKFKWGFALNAWQVSHIEDFWLNQVSWNGEEWRFFDHSYPITPWSPAHDDTNSGTIFDHQLKSYWSKPRLQQPLQQLRLIVLRQRQVHLCNYILTARTDIQD